MGAKKKENLDAQTFSQDDEWNEIERWMYGIECLEAGWGDDDNPFMTYIIGSFALCGDDWNQPNPEKARYYCEKAAKLGSPEAMVLLAQIYLKGIGGRRDARSAWRWLNQAFELGPPRARFGWGNVARTVGERDETRRKRSNGIVRARN